MYYDYSIIMFDDIFLTLIKILIMAIFMICSIHHKFYTVGVAEEGVNVNKTLEMHNFSNYLQNLL